MPGRECYHCKQWIQEGEAHDCWTTTEAALTHDLSDDLRDAWERLRDTAAGFGEQRIYASHHSIMFSRKTCYFFVRPRSKFLEVCVFLTRTLKAPHVRTVSPASKTRVAHLLRITHRDEVEAPITDWLKEAYDANDPARSKTTSRKKQQHSSREISCEKADREKAHENVKGQCPRPCVNVCSACGSGPGTSVEIRQHGKR